MLAEFSGKCCAGGGGKKRLAFVKCMARMGGGQCGPEEDGVAEWPSVGRSPCWLWYSVSLMKQEASSRSSNHA